MGKICVECEDPSWTGQDPIQAPELPVDGGGVKVVDELPETGQKGMAYVLVDDIEAPTTSQGIFVYDEGWILTAQPVSEAVQMVEELPEEGQPGVLYYVPKTGDDTYDLYRWVDDSWIKVDTDVKLYSGTGQNTDGAMTQKATSDAISTSLGKAKVLTSDDYNYPVNNPTRIALWRLPEGIYTLQTSISVYASDAFVPDYQMSRGDIAMVTSDPLSSYKRVYITHGNGNKGLIYKTADGNTAQVYFPPADTIDHLNSTSANSALSAKQGKVLNERVGDLTTLTTTAKTSTVAAINELVTSIGNIETALNAINNGGNS